MQGGPGKEEGAKGRVVFLFSRCGARPRVAPRPLPWLSRRIIRDHRTHEVFGAVSEMAGRRALLGVRVLWIEPVQRTWNV